MGFLIVADQPPRGARVPLEFGERGIAKPEGEPQVGGGLQQSRDQHRAGHAMRNDEDILVVGQVFEECLRSCPHHQR